MKTVTGSIIPRRFIDVSADYERKETLVEDDALRKSIKVSGIQQPLVVLSKSNGRFELIDGYRRLQIASELGMDEVPCVIDSVPDGMDSKIYRDRMRFVIDTHRQDLTPSQRAELIGKVRSLFKMKNKEIALWLGIDSGSVTNWMAVEKYSPEIKKAIDSGEINMHAARAFDGMTEEAQNRVFKKHAEDFRTMAGGKLHKMIRETYSPSDNPTYYRDAENTQKKMEVTQKGRKTKKRPSLSTDEKKRLSRNLGLQETELRDGKEDLAQFNKEITAATPVIRAILRHPELVAMLSEDQREEFGRFAEVYV